MFEDIWLEDEPAKIIIQHIAMLLAVILQFEQVNTRFSKVKDQREEDGVADNFNTVPATLNTVPQKE